MPLCSNILNAKVRGRTFSRLYPTYEEISDGSPRFRNGKGMLIEEIDKQFVATVKTKLRKFHLTERGISRKLGLSKAWLYKITSFESRIGYTEIGPLMAALEFTDNQQRYFFMNYSKLLRCGAFAG